METFQQTMSFVDATDHKSLDGQDDQKKIKCKKCDSRLFWLQFDTYKDGTNHLIPYCFHCRSKQQAIKQNPGEETMPTFEQAKNYTLKSGDYKGRAVKDIPRNLLITWLDRSRTMPTLSDGQLYFKKCLEVFLKGKEGTT